MDDIPRQTLTRLMHQYGREVCQDARRCEALLRDLCGEYKREIFVMISALEEGTVDDLLSMEGQVPFNVMLPRLAAELHETTALSSEAARWAVITWAEALGITPPGETTSLPVPTVRVPEAASNSAVPSNRFDLTHRWRGHTSEVAGVAFSPDGRHVASVGLDAVTTIWDVATAQPAHRLTHQTGILTSVAWHPDGLTLALGSGDAGIYLWPWSDLGREPCRLRGHTAPVTGLIYHPDGHRLISCGRDGRIYVWNIDDEAVVIALQGHTEAVLDIALSPDGKRLASAGGWDQTVRLWDVESGLELVTFTGHRAQVTGVDFDAQGRRIASGSWDETVRVWDLAQHREIWRLSHAGESIHLVNRVTFEPDGPLLVSGGWGGSVDLWHSERGEPLGTLDQHEATIRDVAFGPQGDVLISGDSAGVICLWHS